MLPRCPISTGDKREYFAALRAGEGDSRRGLSEEIAKYPCRFHFTDLCRVIVIVQLLF